MKKSKLALVLLGVSLIGIFGSCGDAINTNPKPNNKGNKPSGYCHISTVSESTGSNNEDSEFIYDGKGKLTRVNTKAYNAPSEYMTFEYNNAGKPIKMSSYNAKNVLQDYFTVYLNPISYPIKIDFYSKDDASKQFKNISRYEYEYNGQNKTSKINMFLDIAETGTLGLAGYMTFKYDNRGNPIHKEYAVVLGPGEAPTLSYSYNYTYDSKENPEINAANINIEPLARNNVTKVVATNNVTNTIDKIQTRDMTYEYNSKNLPTRITTKTLAGVITSQTYTYNCK